MMKIHEADCKTCQKPLYMIPARMNYGGLPDPAESEGYYNKDNESFCEDCFETNENKILEFPQQEKEVLENVIFINGTDLKPVA